MRKIYALILSLMLIASVTNAATKTWNGGTGATLDWTNGANWLPVGAPAANDDIVFGTAGTLTFTTMPASVTYFSLTINAGNITLTRGSASTLTIGGNAGTDLTIASGASLTLGTNINMTMANNATGTIAGTLTVNTGRTFNTNGTSVVTTVTGTISNSGTVTCTTASKLLMQANSLYTHAQNGGNIPTATWASASTCNITGATSTMPSNDAQTFGNFTWNCSGQGTNQLQFGSTLNATGTVTITNTGTVGSGRLELGDATGNTIANLTMNGGTLRFGSNTARTLDVTGKVTISSGTLLMTSGNNVGTLNVAGDFEFTGGTIDETGSGSGAIVFNGVSAQTFTSGGTVSNTINFTVNNGATLNMAAAGTVVSGNTFTVASGGTLGITSAAGIVTAPTASGNIQTTTRTFNAGGNYNYIGTGGAQVTGNALPATINSLTMNNTDGLTLSQDLNISGSMTFQFGVVASNSTNTLTINDNATVSGASNDSYVDGFMVKVGNNDFTFPIGDPAGSYHPLRVNNVGGANGDVYNAEYFRSSAKALGSLSGLYGVSNCEYWVLNRTSGSFNPDVYVSWTGDSPCGGGAYTTSLSGLVVARLNAGVWSQANGTNIAATGSVGTGGSGFAGDDNISAFGTLALGNTAAEHNPLPVKLGNIKAYEKAAGVQLDWTAFTEINVEKYVVERSADGQRFTAIGDVAALNSTNVTNYGFFDPSPLAGVSFYRLRNLDIDGKEGYSNIVRIDLSRKGGGITVYPNPASSGGYISYSSPNLPKGNYIARIFNAGGQQVYTQKFSHNGGAINQTIQLPAAVRSGLHSLQLDSEGAKVAGKTFIVE